MAVRRLCRRAASILACATLIASICGTGVRPAAAQDGATGFTVSLEPGDDPATTAKGYFVYELGHGERATGTLRLTNPTAAAITIDLTAVDALTASNGGSAFATDEVDPTSVGTWLRLEKPRVTVKPGQDRLVGFSVKAPEDARAGQYLAGLAAATRPEAQRATPVTAASNQASASIDLRVRYVIGVEVDVPGDWTPSLTVAGVDLIDRPSGPILGIGLRNDGDVFLKPNGAVTVTDAQGRVVLEQPIQMGTFVTGTEVTYPIAWPSTLSPGTYAVRVELNYGGDEKATYDGSVEAGAGTAPTITIVGVALEESRDRATNRLQYVTIGITVDNPGAPVTNARLTLHVTRDGQSVEDLVLGDALTFPQGTAQASQRYLPPTGWTPGTYGFSVTLDAVDPGSGQAKQLSAATAATTVNVE